MEEPEHILDILEKAEQAIKKENILELKELSNQTVHSASINQDMESIAVAVIIYSMSKILERTNYREYEGWENFISSFTKHIRLSINSLKNKDGENFRNELKKMRKLISGLTGSLKKQIQDVFNRASINKASRIYEHGISMEKTAKLLGISMWELAEYSGRTGIADVNLNITMPIKKRIKIAEEAFK